jgi:hypothetical protein
MSIEIIIISISELQDYDKKELVYKKSETSFIRSRRVQLINTILNRLNDLYYLHGLSAEQCMENNINKLRIRFPEKFEEHRANNRDLESERKELEK